MRLHVGIAVDEYGIRRSVLTENAPSRARFQSVGSLEEGSERAAILLAIKRRQRDLLRKEFDMASRSANER